MPRSGDRHQNVEMGIAGRLRSMLAPRDGDRDRAFKSRGDFGDLLTRRLNSYDKEAVTFFRLCSDC